jgi:hypothetical protein
MPEQYPRLILESFGSTFGKRIGDSLECLFPVPKEDSMTFCNVMRRMRLVLGVFIFAPNFAILLPIHPFLIVVHSQASRLR